MTALPNWALATLAIACAILGAVAWQRARRWWLGRKLTRRFRRARKGEDGARSWLERQGFTVLDAQVTQGATLIVDGDPAPFTVRADYLVERHGVRAVVEVKTGLVASPAARETRRQILEYAWVYDVNEVYLFDADSERLHRILVPSRTLSPSRALRRGAGWLIWIALAAGIAVGVAVGAAGAVGARL